MRLDDSGTPPKSAGLRSMFARSIWLRGGIGTLRDAGAGFSCRPRIVDDHDPDSISLDSGFDHFEVDEDMDGSWIRRYGGGGEDGTELDTALRRNVDKLVRDILHTVDARVHGFATEIDILLDYYVNLAVCRRRRVPRHGL